MIPFIKLTKIERKRFAILLVCLLCAIGAWLFMSLSRTYIYTAATILTYRDFPQKRAFKALQSDTVDLQVEGTGWQLLFARLRVNPQSISVSLDRLNQRNFIAFSEQLAQINRQLETTQRVISVQPDTLYFDFSKRTSKRVPLRLRSDLSFVKQFGMAGNIQLKPAYVNISGPQEELSKIKVWYTDTLRAYGLQDDIQVRVPVHANNQANVSIYPTRVGVHIPVDEFTEKTLEIPLRVLNNNDFLDVNLYPARVKVKFMVALSRYDEITEDFMEANIDLNEWKLLKHDDLRVNLSRFPDFCRLVSVQPAKVNFLIER